MSDPKIEPIVVDTFDDPMDDNMVLTRVIVSIDGDGEVRIKTVKPGYDSDQWISIVEDNGGDVIAIVNGVTDLSTGISTCWTGQ